MPQNIELNNDRLFNALDTIEERRDQALLRIHNYQHQIESYYNKTVKSQPLELGDIVLCKVFENTKELNAGKLGTNWEGNAEESRRILSRSPPEHGIPCISEDTTLENMSYGRAPSSLTRSNLRINE